MQQTISLGSGANTGSGDPNNVAWTKANANFTELYTALTAVRTVPYGGTGASTLTGLIKGNGAAAMTAAVAGTDYALPNQPAAAGTLTGTTLNATVVTSSLTSVGTLAALTVTGSITNSNNTTFGAAGGTHTALFRSSAGDISIQSSKIETSGTTLYINQGEKILNANNGKLTISATGEVTLNGKVTMKLPASATPTSNGDLVVEATNDTTLTFKLKGSDGVVRAGTITLA